MNKKNAWIWENDAGKMFLLVVLYWFSLYVYIPYQSVFLKLLGAGSVLVGIVTGAYGYAQILLRIPLGAFADRISRNKALIVLGTAFPVVASLIRLLFESVSGYLIANIVSGCGAAIWVNIMIDFSKRLSKRSLQHGTALVSAANQMGVLFAFLTSLLLYRDGYMKSIVISSVVCGMLATLLALSLKPYREAEASSESEKDQPVLKATLFNKRLWRFSVFGFFQVGFVSATAQSFSPQYCKELGGSDLEVGLMNVIFMLTSVVFSFLCASKPFKKLGAKVILPAAHLLMAVYCFAVPAIRSVPLLLMMQVIGGIFAGSVVSFAVGEATQEISKRNFNSAMAFYQTLVALGISLLPMLTGVLVNRFNLLVAYLSLGVLSLIVAVYAKMVLREKRAP